MDEPLRILMVSHTLLTPRLGAPSVQLHLADELRAAGHHVDLFGLRDACPRPPRTSVGERMYPSFGRRAVPMIRQRAGSYDVIDAFVAKLPASKAQLRFEGALAIRSPGLHHIFLRFVDTVHDRWDDAPRRMRGSAPIHRHQARRYHRDAKCTFDAADVVLLPNREEVDELGSMGYADVARHVPNGVPDALLDRAPVHDERRTSGREVSVIASWQVHKGRLDWPAIIAAVRARVPDATFLFLGTVTGEREVRADLGDPRGVEVVASYDPRELPRLLAGSAAGALPSYFEGFGLGLVEQMACGVVPVAYDVPGPRGTVGLLDPRLLVAPGDTDGFARALADVLLMAPAQREALGSRARATAAQFRYSAIARETLRAYREALASARGG